MSDLVSHFNVCKQGSVFKQGTDVVLLILLNCSLNLRNRNKLVQFNQDLPKMWPWTTKPVIRVIFSKLRFISERWINKLSIDVLFDNIWPRYSYLKIWNLRVQKILNIEKVVFKVVQMKFLAMHITNQKLSFDIFTVGNLQNIFMECDLYLMC